MIRELTVVRSLFLTVNKDGILHNLKLKCHILAILVIVVTVFQNCIFLNLISHVASLHPRSAQPLDYTVTADTGVGKTLRCYY